MKDERIKTNRPGQPPTIYGGRTFKGWAEGDQRMIADAFVMLVACVPAAIVETKYFKANDQAQTSPTESEL